MTSDFFAGVTRWNVERNGTTRPLPYFYYDNLSLAAIYTASTAAVKKLLPHPDLHPFQLRPGRCLVAFAAFEYRKTDDEPYNEVSISFLASYRKRALPFFSLMAAMKRRMIPSYVWQLPVTTEHARAGGVDLFGYPKFLADIQFSKSQERIVCTLCHEGSEVLRVDGRILPTRRGEPIRYLTCSMEGDALLTTTILINPIEFSESRRRKDVVVQIGENHPICEALREIKLSDNPVVYQYTPHAEAMLFPGRNVVEEP